MINAAKPHISITDPSVVKIPGKLGTASHNNSSTAKNIGNEARTNNRESLIIKMKAGKSKNNLERRIGYCTQLLAKGLSELQLFCCVINARITKMKNHLT